MPCYRPSPALRTNAVTSSGKRTIRFLKSSFFTQVIKSNSPDYLELPCGQCIGCRLERSRQWAMRMLHEASLYDNGAENCFITLTFSEEGLKKRNLENGFDPDNRSLNVRDFQLFMKRLRKKFSGGFKYVCPKTGKEKSFPKRKDIRFFHCGEYGDNFGRPHYHAIIFNLDFPDKELLTTRNGNRLYTSKILSDLWEYGYTSIGSVSFESAAYVARYIVKKVTGKKAFKHYNDGQLKPEYVTMSRRPGIGKKWFDKFYSDAYPSDKVTLKGIKMRPPKYYDSQYEIFSPEEMLLIKERRKSNALLRASDNTLDRLITREKCHVESASRLKRSID